MDFKKQEEKTNALNDYYERLAFELNDGDKGNFLSGWQSVNPFASELFAAVKERSKDIDYGRYVYFDDELSLSRNIIDFHCEVDNVKPEFVFAGQGSTSLLFGITAFLKKIGIKKVYFIPPVYFTMHIGFDRFGIETIPVSSNQPFEKTFSLNLPNEKNSVLVLTDPIWYTGTSVDKDIVLEIAKWQKKTSSLVIIDGSFQYTSWDKNYVEHTAILDASLTFRLICPSKQLAAQGYRFSYVLLPLEFRQDFSWTVTNMNGSANADAVSFAYVAMEVVKQKIVTNQLMDLVRYRHEKLREDNIIESTINPNCGYFIFEKINIELPPNYIKVDGRFFDQVNYPEYTKINLLSPSINLLGI